MAVGVAVLVAACGDDGSDSPDAASPDAARPDAAGGDSGAWPDAAIGCQAIAPPGPRAVIRIPRAVEGEWDLYVVGLAGSLPTCPLRVNSEPLVSGSTGTVGGRFVWSPDSSMLAYEGTSGIAVVDMTGPVPGIPVLVEPQGETDAFLPAWSPDSRWLAYFTTQAIGRRDLWVVELTDRVPATPIRLFDSEDWGVVNTFQWHPQSAGLLFHRSSQTSPTTDLYWYPLPPTPGTRQALDAPGADVMSFSPAGDRIAYVAGSYPEDLYVRRLVDGVARAPRNLSSDDAGRAATYYAWSPDGTRILYTTSSLQDAYLVGVRATDPAPVPVYQGGLTYAQPVMWVDDGRIAVFADDASRSPHRSRPMRRPPTWSRSRLPAARPARSVRPGRPRRCGSCRAAGGS